MKRLAILLIVCACRTTSEAESHMAASAAETLDATGHSETHVEEAPSKVTTTVREYAPPQPQSEEVMPSAERQRMRGSNADRLGPSVAEGAAPEPEHGPLLRETVTVADFGGSKTDSFTDAKSQEREDSTLSSESESKKTYDFLHSPFALLGGLVALAGVAFAAFKLLKPRILP